ncbi:ATP-binding protein [Phormidium sp. FACHB-592]|uniref:ATP-binding protein n=1 Tax=Stenomitos frigidus AS-A4 TaxID=2933935 RepID=A0ABV0KCA5_9CYAN|nr:ATP-binding protein [Phormidium sp. FACHB-592]MBD2077492.1 ATP-binding protein [Phormidium sp. FACHB-592]
MGSKTSQLQVRSTLDELSPVLDWFNQLHQPAIPKTIWMQCQTALAEGLTNAIRHAHTGKPAETPIEIVVTIQARSIEIRIWDEGAAFDLAQRLAALPQTVSPDAIGGRGLLLLQQFSDHLSYVRSGDRNCLLIVKHYAAMA